MNPVEIIRKKREKKNLSEKEIDFLIMKYTEGSLPDYQMSAFLMASYLNGLNKNETAYLTKAMLYSGKVIDLSKIEGIKVDKHSTGGVGDKTSMIIAPIVAAAGVKVPMISGRGLGHTGGTLDKLESIPGFKTSLDLNQYKTIIKKCGAVLMGQTKEIAPADKRIYALRDVTATVESIPLITGSIMSKKLAEGIDGLVLDVKTGSGAFMKNYRDAKKLAQSLTNTAKAFDKKVITFITDMSQPLGNYIGNWLEIHESINVLKGEEIKDLLEVSLNLSGAMLYLGGKADSIKHGIKLSNELIRSGKAFNKFVEIVKLQGGDENIVKNPDRYPKADTIFEIKSYHTGYLKSIDNYEVGMASLELGAGRMIKEDVIDYTAGIIFYPKIGQKIYKGDLIATLFTNKKDRIKIAEERIRQSMKFSKNKVNAPKLIKEIIF
jgi:pyrimidine-nucleoside phosphorylase